jgi:WD40 repeat protein
VSASPDVATTPFKGLSAFQDTELDAVLFCGRAREREVVVANLLASRLTVLYGASGVGKTSLLRAAVAHSIRQVAGTAVVLFSSWAGDPRAGLGEAIDAAVGIESSGTLTERLASASQAVDGDVYVILDQFEEFFLYHERGVFADELAGAVREPSLRANFLLGLREDALSKLDVFKGQIPNLFANYLRLDHLDRDGARAAILGPIERFNELSGQEVRVEPELVEAVLDQVAAGKVDVGRAGRGGVATDETRIEAPYLQLVLERLWEVERKSGSTVLRLATLKELGGAESIVRVHLERALGRLQPEEQDVAATMFDHLVTPSGSKIAHRPGDLAQYAAVREADVMPVLNVLGRERIVRAVDGAGGGERYEIFHDVLADGVLAWRVRRELERDRERSRKHQRRLVIVTALALLGLAAMTTVAIYAFAERSNARSAARRARERALEATALSELSTDPQRAVTDAVAAARTPSSRTEAVLRQALGAARLRRVLPAGGPVSVVAFASSGLRMLAAGSDRHVRIYSAGGALERTLSLGAPVTAASFSPKGELVVAAGGREVTVWDAVAGTRLRTLQLPGSATSATFSPNGRLLLTTAARGGSVVWRIETGKRLTTLEQRPVLTGTFSPDGRLVATLALSGRRVAARVFDARTGRLLHLLAPRAELAGVEFSPKGRLLATRSYAGTYLWDPRTGKRVGHLRDRRGLVTDAEFSPNGAMLAAAGQDGAVRIWDVATGDRRFFLPAHRSPVVAVVWSPDGRFVADASGDRTAFIWEIEGNQRAQRVGSLVGHRRAVTSIAYSPSGRSLLSGSDDRTAGLWDARVEEQLVPLPGTHGANAITASFAPGGHRVVSAGADRTARIWDVGSRRLMRSLSHDARVNDAEFSPNGRLVVTASADGFGRIWDATAGKALQTLPSHGPVLVGRFSPDGSTVATGDAHGGVQLWRTRDGRLLATERQRGQVTDAAFAPGGELLVTAGRDGANVWSIPGGRQVRVLRSPGGVLRVTFSPDGSLVAGAGQDGAARIWEAARGRLRYLLRISPPKHPVSDVTFSPDGLLLLTTGALPRNVATWDVRTGKLLHLLVGHTGTVRSGAFSPDGRWIVTAGPTVAGLWQRDGEEPYFYLRSNATHPDSEKLLNAVSFSPNGRLVLSSSEDGSVRLYRCDVCGDLNVLLALAMARLRGLR